MRRALSLSAMWLATMCAAPSLAQETVGNAPDWEAAVEATEQPIAARPQTSSTHYHAYQPAQADPNSLWNRPTLTGDWHGQRSRIQDFGITFAFRSTQFAFGVAGGVEGPGPVLPPFATGDAFSYTGRGEYDAIVDLEKFGGLPMGKLLIRLEHWYGEYGNVSLRTGAFSPTVFPAALPPVADAPGELFVSNFVITQPLSENFIPYIGKKDVLGAADQDVFAGGDGTHQFVNQALIANPAFLLGLPYTGFTMGAAMPRDWGMMSVFLYDPKDRTQDFFQLNDLFANGVILGGEVKLNTSLLGISGEHHVGGMWKHVELTDLQFNEPPPGVYPEPTVPGFPTLSDSWTVYYGFDQYLVEYTGGAEPEGWGLFGRASISDGNPTPVRFFLSTGIGGDSHLREGKKDNWGVGWYYVGASNEFGPLPQFLFGPSDGTGLEAYYNFQVTPWLNVSPDVQYVRPEARAIANDAFVYGLRVNVNL
ncbi:MAG TPA: carbohydrate porin [Pirellulales bacterium]